MIDLNNVQFIVSPEGIRGAIYYPQLGSNLIIYIHRKNVCELIGLQKPGSKQLLWDRLLNTYNEICDYIEDPGFSTNENSSSSKSIPSQYELQIPEYIRKEAIYFIAMRLNNPVAISYQSKLVTEVIPFFEKYANPQQVTNTPILGQLTDIQNQFICSGPMSMNIFQARRNIIESNLNQLAHFDKMINGINQSKLTIDSLWDQLITWIGNYVQNSYNISIGTCCYDMLSKVYSSPVVNKDSIIECILGNSWLFNIALHCISIALEDVEIDAVDRANNFEFKNKVKYEQCENPLEAEYIDTGKEVVKFEYQYNHFEKPSCL